MSPVWCGDEIRRSEEESSCAVETDVGDRARRGRAGSARSCERFLTEPFLSYFV
jgi:hypothetical protein